MPKKEKLNGDKGTTNDLLTIEGNTSVSVKAGKGDDLIIDQGGADDKVRGNDGNDTVAFYYTGNESGSNDYDADKGDDTLEVHFTRDQWMQLNPYIQTDLDAFLSHLSSGTKKAYEFQSVGIEAGEFEQVRLFVDGDELAPEDDIVIANDDSALLDENTSISGSVLLNDIVPDLVRRVDLQGPNVQRGSLLLDSDGSYQFITGNDFEELAKDEIANLQFSYLVTDATGDTDSATMTISINGQNDAPLLASTTADIIEDGPSVAIDLANLGSDIDSDDDGTTLTYTISGAPTEGVVSIANTTLFVQGGDDFQYLAIGETKEITIEITAADRHGATASKPFIVTVTGSNDLPVLTADNADVVEDASVTIDVLANDSDVDASDSLHIISTAGAVNGSVSLIDGSELVNDTLLYTPNADFSGVDTFEYTVSDGNGGIVTQTASVNVAARADAPIVSHQLIAGATAMQFTMRVSAIQTDLDGSEVIDRIELQAVDGNGNALDLSPYVDKVVWSPSQASGNVSADFNFTLPAGTSSDFVVTATAVSKEPSNGHEAASATSLNVEATGNSASSSYTFNANNQSIWASGDAFNYNTAVNIGGSIDESAEFGASVIGPIDIRVAGTGATTHFSTVVRTEVDLDIGLQSRFGIQGGDVDAVLNYDTNVTSTFNKTTDTLSIQTQASNFLLGNGFNATTPNISFEQLLTDFDLDMGFAMFFWGYLHIHYTAGTSRVVHMPDINGGLSIGAPVGIDLGGLFGSDGLSLARYDGNSLHLLEGLYTQSEYSGTKEDAWGNELFSWLLNSHRFNNSSDSANWGYNQVTGSESRNFASIRFDLDGIVAHMRNQPNPVHQEFDFIEIGPLYANAGAELVDVDLVLSSAYRQDNFLQPGQLNGTVVFEDDSRIDFRFGDEINIANASARDANGDGNIDYYFIMKPDAQFQTNAYIDISLRDEVDILSAHVAGGVENFGGISLNEGPIEEWNGTIINQHIPIQLVGTSFGLDVGAVNSAMWVV